jgi:radical SAM protein with 4Fe4S-binding SPASM domain
MSAVELALPTHIEIEPTETCNLRCRMCHVSYMPVENRPRLSAALIDKLSDLRGAYVIIGSGFEPMMNPEFATIVRKLTRLENSLELVTNGTLLSADNVDALKSSKLESMTFSFDGISEQSYEWIRRGASYSKTIDAIVKFRSDFQDRSTVFAVNSTMMRANFEETLDIVDFWDRANFDMVRLINMVIRDADPALVKQSLYPVRKRYQELLDEAAVDAIERQRRIVLRSAYFTHSPLRSRYPDCFMGDHVISTHPGTRVARMVRQELQYGAGPGMSFPCRSPFTFARILFNGDVQLCSKYSIGNLANASFKDIWFGDKAQWVRETVSRDNSVCEACDYFRFCISSPEVDPERAENYFSEHILALAGHIDFETGTSDLVLPKKAPRLVEYSHNASIVEYGGSYFVIPLSLGAIDLTVADATTLPSVPVASGLRQARRVAADLVQNQS